MLFIIDVQDRLVGILNSKNNDFLDQIIIQLFEHLFLEFFDNIDKIDENSEQKDKECFKEFLEIKDKGEKKYKKYMIFEKSLDIFEKCIIQISRVV